MRYCVWQNDDDDVHRKSSDQTHQISPKYPVNHHATTRSYKCTRIWMRGVTTLGTSVTLNDKQRKQSGQTAASQANHNIRIVQLSCSSSSLYDMTPAPCVANINACASQYAPRHALCIRHRRGAHRPRTTHGDVSRSVCLHPPVRTTCVGDTTETRMFSSPRQIRHYTQRATTLALACLWRRLTQTRPGRASVRQR